MIEWTYENGQEGVVTPKDRRDYIHRIFSETTYGEDTEAVTDILADIMHYCALDGVNFEDVLETARGHFESEVGGEVIEDDDKDLEGTCEPGDSVPC